MQISLIQILLIGLVTALAAWDDLVGYFGFMYPLPIGFLTGLILGSPLQGLVYGGFFELIFLGLKPIGGAQPPNRMVGSALGVAFAIISGQSPEVTLAIAFPAALMTQAAITFWFAVGSSRVPMIEALIEKGEIDKASRAVVRGTVYHALIHGAIVVVALLLGAQYVEGIIKSMPLWLLDGFKLAGRILPGVGFAIILNYFFKAGNSMYFFLGFLIAAYLKVPPIGLSFIAICIIFIQYRASQDTLSAAKAASLGGPQQDEGI